MYKINHVLLLNIVFLLIIGCKKDHQDLCPRIDLAATVETDLLTHFPLERIAQFIGPFNIGGSNPEYLLSSYRIFPIDEKSFIVTDGQKVMRALWDNGDIMCRYSNRGRSSLEYQLVLNCSYSDGKVYISDPISSKIIICDVDGKAEKQITLKPREELYPLGNGLFAKLFPPDSEKHRLYDVIDESGKVIRESSIHTTNYSSAILQSPSVLMMEENPCILPAFCDTLYHISATTDSPLLFFDKGKFRVPSSYYSDLQQLNQHADEYIDIQSVKQVGAFIFVEYFKSGMHRIIYDLETGKAVFSIIIKDGTEPVLGIPFDYNGRTLFLWPSYSDNRHIVFTSVPEEEYWLFSR